MRDAVAFDAKLIGIYSGGAWLAERLADMLDGEHPVGYIDVSFYRDDYAQKGLRAKLATTTLPFEVPGSRIVLVDDVLYTGRTVRAALTALADLGRPESVELAALVDRGERELPIRADYVGRNIAASDGQRVYVRLSEVDGVDAVLIGEQKPEPFSVKDRAKGI